MNFLEMETEMDLKMIKEIENLYLQPNTEWSLTLKDCGCGSS